MRVCLADSPTSTPYQPRPSVNNFKDALNCLYHNPQIPNLLHEILRNVQGLAGYGGTSEIEHGLCACTVDNPSLKLGDYLSVQAHNSCSNSNLYHNPQIPNLFHEILRNVQGLHWLSWYK